MRKLSLLFGVAFLLAMTSCQAMGNMDKVSGSGQAKTETRQLAPFTAIEMKCAGTINVVAQGAQKLEISGDDNIVPLITTEVRNNTLYIAATKDYDPKNNVQINISTPDLARFVFAGAGEATLSNIKNNRVEIVASGAGAVTASGETKEADITLSGAGSVNTKNLLAQKTTATSKGVGQMDVYASEQIDATTSGVGNINYYGDPKTVNKHAGGMGEISQK
jgi:Putative auto-transporter adhesin, head GIN domain